jgi:PadR family transcriptional regulator PadR
MRRTSRRAGPAARCRWRVGPGEWEVRARVERFSEPAVLLLLQERAAHGYELLEQLPSLTGDEPVDMGNLYRFLRGLEGDAIVGSEWRDKEPGASKRVYELTADGRELLERWVAALAGVQRQIERFLARHERGKEARDVRT